LTSQFGALLQGSQNKRACMLDDTLVVWGGEFGPHAASRQGPRRGGAGVAIHHSFGRFSCRVDGPVVGSRADQAYGAPTDDFGFERD